MAYLIEKGFFGQSNGCSGNQSDTVWMQSAWNVSDIRGRSLKVEHKLRLPNYQEFSFFTTPVYVNDYIRAFSTASFTRPIPAGGYEFLWAVLYDSAGNVMAEG